jgi:cobyrinic acid a,c-diamide synthase
MVAAPHSGSGKTVVTLGLLRALRRRGMDIRAAKAGPDYIDPAFHAASSGGSCINLDPWAMRATTLLRLSHAHAAGGDLMVVEAMMGLFDGAADGSASAADLAAMLDVPIIFVVDCSRMAQSVAALVRGYRDHRRNVKLAGVILNRVGSARHEAMLRDALAPIGVPVLGAVPAIDGLVLPERHLGLVQASEHEELNAFCDLAADAMERHCDLDALAGLGWDDLAAGPGEKLSPLGQRIAIARDDAFAFLYPHLLSDWRAQGAQISFFSPLADEAPDDSCDAVFLPGGYPELHGAQLGAADRFRTGLKRARDRGAMIYGECGGYMVLGESLIDAAGKAHPMAGLLPVETSFEHRKRHLGYRRIRPLQAMPWSGPLMGHEFHYSVAVREQGAALFEASDATGQALGACGVGLGRVCGSYLHIIDAAEQLS